MQRNDLTPEELERLEALARAATPGPWRVEMGSPSHGPSGNARNHVLTSSPTDQHWSHGTIAVSAAFRPRDGENWAHIAAASPNVVLALVEAARERDRLIGERLAMRGEIEELRTLVASLIRNLIRKTP